MTIQPPETPEIDAFLLCKTPQAWVDHALENLDILLIDHAQCEKKAAATAMSLMHKHVDRPELLKKMSQLAREELLHFEQVVNLLQERGIAYQNLTPARYAEGLRQAMRTDEHGRFIDLLIIGGIIEARSCERFAALIPYLDANLAKYYRSLIKSEARHFEDYLYLAELYEAEKPGKQPLKQRIQKLLEVEKELIESPDPQFRFHSGVPT
ncbi:tRNA-(ms[2]io[6]A)-hydroxylase [Marinospirillum celere]|uniref:tRNA-(Ms[2]io[6]A)-hydroxylase n=1 Tax=Marinospirillum celere TaxID=1122252 RepID=A0A1I1EET6_9GAMM|nr:tRNA-(ms[2]io[6]A)-hydroxylase [Marinospirillum celere]SFB83443.1 tRNA-(ms[2]io[6]A)-hydroxylase [Marinospirillum celere]